MEGTGCVYNMSMPLNWHPMGTCILTLVLSLLGVAATTASILKEDFDGLDERNWDQGWIHSEAIDKQDAGRLQMTENPWLPSNKGLLAGQNFSYFNSVRPLDVEFDNLNKDLVLQFSVRFLPGAECVGGYVKLLSQGPSNSFTPEEFTGNSDYSLMFGPDNCGEQIIQFWLRSRNVLKYPKTQQLDTLQMNRTLHTEVTDVRSHMYTLILYHDTNEWEILVDGIRRGRALIEDSFRFLPPRMILDMTATKPVEWVEDEMIPAKASSGKPPGYDDIPRFIPDMRAEKPEYGTTKKTVSGNLR